MNNELKLADDVYQSIERDGLMDTIKKHFGAHLANRTVLYATFLKHGNWKLYNLGSAIYYKFYSFFKK